VHASHGAFYNGEPDSGAGITFAIVQALKYVPNPVLMLRCDADTIVANGQPHTAIPLLGRDIYLRRCAIFVKLECIGKEIEHDLRKDLRVRLHRQRIGNIHLEGRSIKRFELSHRLLDRVRQRYRLQRQINAAHAPIIEQVLHQSIHARDRTRDFLQILAPLIVQALAVILT